MLTDQLQDSPHERSAPARELKRRKFSEVPKDFNNIPDPTTVGRPPTPSTTPSQPGEQREPARTDQMPEKLSKIMERTAQTFCKQLRHRHRAKERLEQATETVKFLKESPSRYPSGCTPFSSCVTWSELDETWQYAGEAGYTWHITFAKGSTKT